MHRFSASLLLFTSLFATAHTTETDSVSQRQMREVSVVAPSYALPNEQQPGRTYWQVESLKQLPHLFGTADPIRFLQMLPGVGTNNDYSSGIHIQGCSTAHNVVELAGAPVFNPSHLLGLFSVFTPSHFRGMALVKNMHGANFSNHLGGHLTFYPIDTLANRVHLNATFSFMESEGTLTLPTGSRGTLHLSGRGSYLNLLYKNALKLDEAAVRYALQDYNLTYTARPNARNRILASLYRGNDRFSLLQNELQIDGSLKWGNTVGSVVWDRQGSLGELRQTAYASHYRNDFGMDMEAMQLNLYSSILQAGYKGELAWEQGVTHVTTGAEYTYYSAKPLELNAEGVPTGTLEAPERTQAHELSAFAQADFPLGRRVNISGGLLISLFHPERRTYAALSPRLTLSYRPGRQHQIHLHYGIYHQYLHQITLTNGGLPVDYRIPSSIDLPPETAHSWALGYRYRTPGRTYELSVEVYYKRLRNQWEFNGAIFELFNAGSSLSQLLMKGKGNNYGIDLMLKRNRGPVTGWISYTLGRSDRRFPALSASQWFPSAFDRRHDLAVVATYRINRRWNLGADFVFASGTPYTKARSIYVINNNLISEYGPHNGARLSPSHRVDLSATYTIGTRKGCDQSLNLSVFNLYAHTNELFRYMGYEGGRFTAKPVYSLCRVLPSVGYTIKF